VRHAGALEAGGGHAKGCNDKEEDEDDHHGGWGVVGGMFRLFSIHRACTPLHYLYEACFNHANKML
jgi:hypothetical protein